MVYAVVEETRGKELSVCNSSTEGGKLFLASKDLFNLATKIKKIPKRVSKGKIRLQLLKIINNNEWNFNNRKKLTCDELMFNHFRKIK